MCGSLPVARARLWRNDCCARTSFMGIVTKSASLSFTNLFPYSTAAGNYATSFDEYQRNKNCRKPGGNPAAPSVQLGRIAIDDLYLINANGCRWLVGNDMDVCAIMVPCTI